MHSKKSTQNKYFNARNSIDFLLINILEQIKFISTEGKDAPYKLIELFFKGVELKEKLNMQKKEDSTPQISFIEGINEEKI